MSSIPEGTMRRREPRGITRPPDLPHAERAVSAWIEAHPYVERVTVGATTTLVRARSVEELNDAVDAERARLSAIGSKPSKRIAQDAKSRARGSTKGGRSMAAQKSAKDAKEVQLAAARYVRGLATGQALKVARMKARLSRKELEVALDVSTGMASRWEAGTRVPSAENAERLEQLLPELRCR